MKTILVISVLTLCGCTKFNEITMSIDCDVYKREFKRLERCVENNQFCALSVDEQDRYDTLIEKIYGVCISSDKKPAQGIALTN